MNPEPESFSKRDDNPTRWQTCLNPHPPLVSCDISATWLVCFAFMAFLVLFVGLVAWPGRAT